MERSRVPNKEHFGWQGKKSILLYLEGKTGFSFSRGKGAKDAFICLHAFYVLYLIHKIKKIIFVIFYCNYKSFKILFI